ncbi:unnamed protein product [Echinostoma caproni]|uniref:Uncharacterized protein n=1 Tax=Echinostoma caproni TaxID=27848 RepID=A0A183ATY0_9TREM|nr:unnamed protein product [Echinostoma caproni]
MLRNSRNIYMNIPVHKPYDVLKEALLRRLAISEEKRIQLLPSRIQLGSSKPSQLPLNRQRATPDLAPVAPVLRAQNILNVFAHAHSLDELAEAVDRAME